MHANFDLSKCKHSHVYEKLANKSIEQNEAYEKKINFLISRNRELERSTNDALSKLQNELEYERKKSKNEIERLSDIHQVAIDKLRFEKSRIHDELQLTKDQAKETMQSWGETISKFKEAQQVQIKQETKQEEQEVQIKQVKQTDSSVWERLHKANTKNKKK